MKQNKVPKNEYIRKPVSKTDPYKYDVIYGDLGQYAHQGEITRIPSGDITMQGVPYPVYGEDNLGYSQMMYPGMDYKFPGKYVTEYPMVKNGGGLLNKTLTCPSCGWSWKAVDGGTDIATCHKCGGTAKLAYGGDPSLPNISGHYPFGGIHSKTHTHMDAGGESAEVVPPIRRAPVSRAPIYVTDPEDYRYRAYNDSLWLHQNNRIPLPQPKTIDYYSIKDTKQRKKTASLLPFESYYKTLKKGVNPLYDNAYFYNIKHSYKFPSYLSDEEYFEVEPENTDSPYNYGDLPTNKPTFIERIDRYYPHSDKKLFTGEDYGYHMPFFDDEKNDSYAYYAAPRYDKPVQPVILINPEKSKVIKPSMTKDKKGKPMGVIGQKPRVSTQEKKQIEKPEIINPDYLPMIQASMPEMIAREPEIITSPTPRPNNTNNRISWRMDPETRKMVPVYLEGKTQKVKEGKRLYNKNIPSSTAAIPADFIPQFEPDDNADVVSKQMGGWLDDLDKYQGDKRGSQVMPSETTQSFIPASLKYKMDQLNKQNPKYQKELAEEKKFYADVAKAEEDARKKEISDRKARIANSIKAQDEKLIGNPNWREVLARQTQATGDKLRISDEPNFFDDYINPAAMIGSMASGLGQAPYQAQQTGSYMPYVYGVGMPLVAGALAGIGAKSTGQFVNNIVNPLAGIIPTRNAAAIEKNLAKQNKVLADIGIPEEEMLITEDQISRAAPQARAVTEARGSNQLPPPPSEIQIMPDGTTRTVYNQQPITDYTVGPYVDPYDTPSYIYPNANAANPNTYNEMRDRLIQRMERPRSMYDDIRLGEDYTNLIEGRPAQYYPHLSLEENRAQQDILFEQRNRLFNEIAREVDLTNILRSFDQNPSIVEENIVNVSGLNKEQALQRAAGKEKDKIAKMSDTEFKNTVLNPNGEIVKYKKGPEINNLTYDMDSGRMALKNQNIISQKEYLDLFNSNLDRLNEIIASKNKSVPRVEYKVKGLNEQGHLTFETPEQIIPRQRTQAVIDNYNAFQEHPEIWAEEKAGLRQNEDGSWQFNEEVGTDTYSSKEAAMKALSKAVEDQVGPMQKLSGESVWGVEINPGKWQGEVEDIANKEYYRAIPGLEMSNTMGTVFPDRVARRGTKAYESINDYLKELGLGRVKPGFNSQTEFSQSAWEDFVKKGKAFGYYGDPKTVYGSMKSVLPYLGLGYLGQQGLSDNEEYRRGGAPYTPANLKRQSKKKGTSKNIESSINQLFLKNFDLYGSSKKGVYNPYSKYKEGGWLDEYQDAGAVLSKLKEEKAIRDAAEMAANVKGRIPSSTYVAPGLMPTQEDITSALLPKYQRDAIKNQNAAMASRSPEAQLSQGRPMTKQEKAYSEKVKSRIANPAADIGILAGNVASALSRGHYLTPEEIAQTTNNPMGAIGLSSNMATQALANEMIAPLVLNPGAIKKAINKIPRGPAVLGQLAEKNINATPKTSTYSNEVINTLESNDDIISRAFPQHAFIDEVSPNRMFAEASVFEEPAVAKTIIDPVPENKIVSSNIRSGESKTLDELESIKDWSDWDTKYKGKNIAKAGHFNRGVFEIKGHPEFLAKIEEPTAFDADVDLVGSDYVNLDFPSLHKDITSPNVGKVVKQFPNPKNPNQRILVMKKVEGKALKDISLPQLKKIPDEAFIQLDADLRDLRNKGLAADFVGDNILYNAKDKSFKIIDLSPTKTTMGPTMKDFWYENVIRGVDQSAPKQISARNIRNSIMDKLNDSFENNMHQTMGPSAYARKKLYSDDLHVWDQGQKLMEQFVKIRNATNKADIFKEKATEDFYKRFEAIKDKLNMQPVERFGGGWLDNLD